VLRRKRYEDFWCIAVGGPIGNLVAAVLAEVPWVSANVATIASLVTRLVAYPFVAGLLDGDLLAAALLQVGSLLDVIDGALARERGPSALGAFLDKTCDAICAFGLGAAVGWRVFAETGDPLAILAGSVLSACLLIRWYTYWVIRFMELQLRTAGPAAGEVAGVVAARHGGSRLSVWLRPLYCGEADVYFWVSCALVVGFLPLALWVLAGVMVVWLVVVLVTRVIEATRVDGART
jgi:phosphatidylglycerophosphate synthase